MRSPSRHLRSLLLALALAAGACASSPAPTVEAPPREQTTATIDSPGLFLYEVSIDGKPCHLLGTIHMGFGLDEVLRGEARERFDSAETVVLEADVTRANPQQLMMAALLPPGQSLRSKIAPATWNQLVTKLEGVLPEPALERLKPWMPATMLGLLDIQDALEEARPEAAGKMMDLELMQAAKGAGKSLAYLETIEEQIAIFEAIPEPEQIAELGRALEAESSAAGRSMIDAFARGDEEALNEALFDAEQMRSAPGFYNAILFERNDRWLPVIVSRAREGGLFVAVGAAHLLGERGILAQLEARGYAATRVIP